MANFVVEVAVVVVAAAAAAVVAAAAGTSHDCLACFAKPLLSLKGKSKIIIRGNTRSVTS